MRPDLNDDHVYVAVSKAFVAACLIAIVVYVWLVVAGDTGMGGL